MPAAPVPAATDAGTAAGQPAAQGVASRPSRRVSTCVYTITFPPGGVELSDDARRVLADAVAEARKRGSRALTVSPTEGNEEPAGPPRPGGVVGPRIEAVVRGLVRAGQPAERINTAVIHDYVPGPGVGVASYVCDPMTPAEARRHPPEQPDQRVEFLLGPARVRVPLRFDPSSWGNTPLEPEKTDVLPLRIPWPEPFVPPGSYTPCKTDGSGEGCTDEIVVELRPLKREPATSAPGGGLPRLHAAPEPRREVGVIEGLRFFAYRTPMARVEGPFEGRDAAGRRVMGTCRWGQSEVSPSEAASLGGVRRLLKGGRCRFEGMPLGPDLHVTIRFPASRLPEWRAIYGDILRLLESFVA